MHPNEFEAKMRKFEAFHGLTAIPDAYIILRIDGRTFHKRTVELNFEKPFDEGFHIAMQKAAAAVMEDLGGIYAYTESDEISVLLPKNSVTFHRSVEKLVSCSASMATATFNAFMPQAMLMKHLCTFDSRLIVAPTEAVVVDYFRWRQADAGRCALNGYVHWQQIKSGMSARKAASNVEGMDVRWKMDRLHELGINFAKLPGWQINGTGIYHQLYNKIALNPKTGQTVNVVRRKIKVDEKLQSGDKYSKFIKKLLK